MRTIKFRGLDFQKKMVYGDLHHKRFTAFATHMIEDTTGLGSDVIPETIGQFTGLLDKYGVEIYEGDILKVDIFTKPYKISFGKSEKWGACFCVQSHNSITFLTKNWSDTCEVIGNIHENIELLEG